MQWHLAASSDSGSQWRLGAYSDQAAIVGLCVVPAEQTGMKLLIVFGGLLVD